MANNAVKQSTLNKARQDKFLLVFDVPPVLRNISSNITDDKRKEKLLPACKCKICN